MTRLTIAAVLACAAVLPPARQAGGSATLAGRVVRDATPVARAVVSIDAGDNRIDRQTVSDDDGRFLFDGLPGGRYLITASKTGWVTTYYGSPRPGRPPGVRVALADDARMTVEVPMVPGGVIAGRVVSEEGRPMPRQWPWLLEQRLVGDRRMLARSSLPYDVGNFERPTDDRGEFRLFGLAPGTYYLVLNPSIESGARLTTAAEVRWAIQPPGTAGQPAPALGPVAGYASLYFPGTPDPAAAQPIAVGPGEVRDGLTFRVSFVPVARVTGIVRRADGSPAAGSTVSIGDREVRVSLEGASRTARTDAEGRFVLQGVPPGVYRLTVRAASPALPGAVAQPAPPMLDLWGQTDVVVAGSDVEGVGIALARASAIEGRLAFTRTSLAPPEDLATVRLRFIAAESLAAVRSGAGLAGSGLYNATVQADGAFRAEGLPPGRYIADATWPGMRTGDGTTGWWMTTIAAGGRDLGDVPIDVRPNEDVREITIAFRDRIGTIEGTLTGAVGRPAPEYFVLVFPAERGSWTTTSRRAVAPARPGTDGRFRITGLVAGDYYLAVVTVVGQDEALDPAFLEAILPSAIRVTVIEGETRRQDIRIGGK